MENVDGILQMINGGGNAALIVCTFFIYRASERLARIEKALDAFITKQQESR